MSAKRADKRADGPAQKPAAQPAPEQGPAWLPTAAAAARLLVGAVFLASGLEKAAMPPEEFAAIIQGYWLLPPSAHLPLALALPPIEVLTGLALLAGYNYRGFSAAAGGLFLAFIVALASTLLRGIPLPDCGCFGRGVHLSVPQALGLDSALLCLSYLAYRKGAALSWLDRWVEKGTP